MITWTVNARAVVMARALGPYSAGLRNALAEKDAEVKALQKALRNAHGAAENAVAQAQGAVLSAEEELRRHTSEIEVQRTRLADEAAASEVEQKRLRARTQTVEDTLEEHPHVEGFVTLQSEVRYPFCGTLFCLCL